MKSMSEKTTARTFNAKKLAKDSTRFAVLEYQQKLNNWLTGAICGGIIALHAGVIKKLKA